MPILNGAEFLAAYTLQPGQHTTIIMISGDPTLVLKFSSGIITDVLRKPIELADLLKLISKYAQPIFNENKPE